MSAPGSVSLAQAGAVTPNSNAALAATVNDRFMQILLILSTLTAERPTAFSKEHLNRS